MGVATDGLQLGQRVVVRHRLPRPDAFGRTLTDVVGELVARDVDSLVVATRRGEVRVPTAAVTVVKVVPARASRRGAAHRALSVEAMQEVMVGAWGALDREWLGRWLLRAGGGYTQRANSVALLGDPGVPLTEAIARAKAWYAARSLPLNVTLAGPCGFVVEQDPVGALLLDRGAKVSARCLTLTADVASVSARARGSATDHLLDGSTLDVSPDLGDDWLAAHRGYRTSGGFAGQGAADMADTRDTKDTKDTDWVGAADAEDMADMADAEDMADTRDTKDTDWVATARAVLTGSPAQLFATLRDGSGAVIGVGRAGLTPGWVGLGSIWIDPAHRRRGLAQVITRALLDEAVAHGHRSAHLQVLDSNAPARALYADMGFQPHHDYVNLIQGPVEWSPDEQISGPIPSSTDHSTRDTGPITAQREDHT